MKPAQDIDLDLLGQFCSTDRPKLAMPFLSYNYRGPDAVNYDVCATDGRILLCVHEAWVKGLEEITLELPTPCWWAMAAIANEEPFVSKATDDKVSRIPEDVMNRLRVLPGLAFMSVLKVQITVSGRTTRKRWQTIYQNGVVYFRWNGGVGMAAVIRDEHPGRKEPA